jgi:hypothetical protein
MGFSVGRLWCEFLQLGGLAPHGFATRTNKVIALPATTKVLMFPSLEAASSSKSAAVNSPKAFERSGDGECFVRSLHV